MLVERARQRHGRVVEARRWRRPLGLHRCRQRERGGERGSRVERVPEQAGARRRRPPVGRAEQTGEVELVQDAPLHRARATQVPVAQRRSRRRDQRGQEGRLEGVELRRVAAEPIPARLGDPPAVAAPLDRAQVGGDDGALVELALEPARDQRFAQLAPHGRRVVEKEVARELLRDGAAAHARPVGHEVLECLLQLRPVEPVMIEERAILGFDYRAHGQRRHALERRPDRRPQPPASAHERGHHRPLRAHVGQIDRSDDDALGRGGGERERERDQEDAPPATRPHGRTAANSSAQMRPQSSSRWNVWPSDGSTITRAAASAPKSASSERRAAAGETAMSCAPWNASSRR